MPLPFVLKLGLDVKVSSDHDPHTKLSDSHTHAFEHAFEHALSLTAHSSLPRPHFVCKKTCA